MKTLIIGDIHGRMKWKNIISNEIYDRIIFVGDYFDTHDKDYSTNRQIENFKEIIAFKKANMDKVVLLIGNHDYHYMDGIIEKYSGYQIRYSEEIGKELGQALSEDLLQMCFSFDDILVSHAGVTNTWCKNNDIDKLNVVQSINDLFKTSPSSFSFAMGENYSQIGDDITQSPIWVRPRSLHQDQIEGYKQIVGHTQARFLMVSETSPIICVDTLGTSGEYLIYEDKKFNVKSI